MVPESDAGSVAPTAVDADDVATLVTVSVAAVAFLYGVFVAEHVLAGQFYALLAVATYLVWVRVRDLDPAGRPDRR